MSAPQDIHACHDERVLSHVQSENHPNTALTVSELNREAKYLLESHFDWITVEGEIGNFTAASSGHWYFSLKDTDAQVRCAMFRRANGRVKTRPQQGDSVRIRAKVSLYEGRGEFQLICEHLEPAGAGALQLAFEKLKRQLSEEGLFAADSKQPVPHDASHVGVVTSATGAALQDILTVLERRSPHTQVYVFPVAVQGEGAAEQVAAAVTQANQLTKTGAIPLDVLIVGRGGGSLEDLWAFNEEVRRVKKFESGVVKDPIKDGWTACQEAKSDADICAIPIIALTAHAMEEDRQRALNAGCCDYATKPVDFPELLNKIAAQLDETH